MFKDYEITARFRVRNCRRFPGRRKLFAADGNPANPAVTTTPVYVPDTSHSSEPLADGVIAWNNTMKETNAAADASNAHFVFNFTNVSPGNVVILNVHTSCGCTTAQLPPLPWTVPSGTNGQIGVNVNIAGKSGSLFKTVTVTADKGTQTLMVKINILPPVTPTLSDADRERGIEIAKADRQAVFHGDCAACHVKPGQGKYGKLLFDADCAICHEGEHRATHGAGFACPQSADQYRVLADVDITRQTRLAHARLFHR